MSANESQDGLPLVHSVLIVDDEKVVRDVLSRLLASEADLSVTTVASAEEGLELLTERRFDLLVTDKNLPGIGGVELIARARALRPAIEAIVITGYGSAESILAAMANGASDYVLKPFRDVRLLRAKVRASLARRDETLRVREEAAANARLATHLLRGGRDAPEPVWRQLDLVLRQYEQIHHSADVGAVLVCGREEVADFLIAAGLKAMAAPQGSPALEVADVVVVDTNVASWREVAKALRARGADVLAVASEECPLEDLLDAVGMGVQLVGFGGAFPPKALPERVITAALRRRLEAAQVDLARAVERFQRSLSSAA